MNRTAFLALCIAALVGVAAAGQGKLRAEPDFKPCSFKTFWGHITKLCTESDTPPDSAACARAARCISGQAVGDLAAAAPTPAPPASGEDQADVDKIRDQINVRFTGVPDGFQCKDATKATDAQLDSAAKCQVGCMRESTCVGADFRSDGCYFCTSSLLEPLLETVQHPDPGPGPTPPVVPNVVALRYDGETFDETTPEMTCDKKAPFEAGKESFTKCHDACKDSTDCRGFVYYVKEGGNRLCWHCPQKAPLRPTKVKGCKKAGKDIPCCETFVKKDQDPQAPVLPDLQVVKKIAGGFYIGWTAMRYPLDEGPKSFLVSNTAVRFPDGDVRVAGWTIARAPDYEALLDRCTVPLGVGQASQESPRDCKDGARVGMGIAKQDDSGSITHIYVTGGLQVKLAYSTGSNANKLFECNSLRWRYTVCQLPEPVKSVKWTV